MALINPVMMTSYDYRLVVLSILISILASYAALDLAGRVTAARGRVRLAWLAGGACAMGMGIWSMHYIGMLAFSLPITVAYDWPTVAASLLCAIFASGVALFVVSRPRMSLLLAGLGSVVMGSGIAAMHYTGMAAMRLQAECSYSPILVSVSIGLAIVISLVALWLSFTLREGKGSLGWKKKASAVLMGAAIPVMHYTGMAAAHFSPSGTTPDLRHAVNISSLGIASITIVTFFVLGVTLLTSVVDRRFSEQALELESSEQRYRQLVESAQVILWRRDIQSSQFSFVNKEAEVLLGYPVEDWLTRPNFWAEHIHPDDRALAESSCTTAASQCQTQEFELRMIAADGETLWLRCCVRVIAGAAHANELVGVMMDITARKRAQEAAEACQPDQERISGQHESRNPHPDEWNHRHGGVGARYGVEPRAARISGDAQSLGRFAARYHQRHPGLLQNRGRQAGFGFDRFQPAEHSGNHNERTLSGSPCQRSRDHMRGPNRKYPR